MWDHESQVLPLHYRAIMVYQMKHLRKRWGSNPQGITAPRFSRPAPSPAIGLHFLIFAEEGGLDPQRHYPIH